MITFNNPQVPPSGLRGLLHINILLISAFLLGGCNTKDPIATPSVDSPVANVDYSIINGDTIKTVIFKDYKKLHDKDPNGKNYIVVGDTIITYREPKLHTPPTQDPDLSKLKNNYDPDLKGKPLRMIAIGGSLTAGVRDGGYFNEGILTSYPNLIARQMKLQKFEQPLFDATDYNGFGLKVRTGFNPTGGPVPKFNEVKNNSGVESVDEKGVKLKAYKTKIGLDNFAIPYVLSDLFRLTSFNSGIPSENKSSTYYQRLLDVGKTTNDLLYKNNKYDMFIMESGFNDMADMIFNGSFYSRRSTTNPVNFSKDLEKDLKLYKNKDNTITYAAWQSDLSSSFAFIAESYLKGTKYGCIINTPNILEFPYFKIVPNKMVENVFKSVNNLSFDTRLNIYCFPNSTIDSLLSTKVHVALKPGINNRPLTLKDFIPDYRVSKAQEMLNDFNTEKELLSKKFGYPVVDIFSLYNKILKGEFTSDDGVKVDPSFPKGNFFSNDGIYPTPFGQAIITNEVIKVLNNTYKTAIPLIPTREYLDK